MRVHVVSDVHGHAEALAQAGDGADALVCLATSLISSTTPTPPAASSAELFGPEDARRFVAAAHRPRLRGGPRVHP